MNVVSQNTEILKHLKESKTITAIEALQFFGCLRLAARIKDLRDDGHDIATTMIPVKSQKYGYRDKRVAEYVLVKVAKQSDLIVENNFYKTEIVT